MGQFGTRPLFIPHMHTPNTHETIVKRIVSLEFIMNACTCAERVHHVNISLDARKQFIQPFTHLTVSRSLWASWSRARLNAKLEAKIQAQQTKPQLKHKFMAAVVIYTSMQ